MPAPLTATRVLLGLILVASHLLGRNACGGQPPAHILVTITSSQLTQGTVLHTFEAVEGASYQLLHHPQDCPEGTFTVEGQDLVLTSNVTLQAASEEPVCLPGADSSASHPTVRTYRCFAVEAGMAGIPLTILVQPEFLSTELTFPHAFYSGSVVEGLENTTVSVDTPGLAALTLPSQGLLLPAYRLTGEHVGVFTVLQQQVACGTRPTLVATQPLDRETRDYYELTLEAYAPYAPTLVSASTTVGVTVSDVNDHPPSFVPTPPQSLPLTLTGPGIRPGSTLATFRATDPDAGRNGDLRFSLDNVTTPFTLHPLSGGLFPFRPLAPQSPPAPPSEFPLSLRVQDLGDPSLSSTAAVTVFINTTTNDIALPPHIAIHGVGLDPGSQQQGELLVSSSELLSVGELVAMVNVTSQAQSSLGVILELVNVGPCACFSLSEPTPVEGGVRYEVMVAGELDFESTPDATYRLSLTASDTGHTPPLTSSLELLVQVSDENEPPSFPTSGYAATLLEGSPVGTDVVQLRANDPDAGTNGTLTYSLLSSPADNFAVDPDSGLVYTMAEVDFDSPPTLFQLTVMVADGGGLNVSTSLVVTLQDLNDNPPSFLPSSRDQSVSIPEDHAPDMPIFQFVALDQDTGCNGAVEYSILHSDPNVFSLDRSSGLLYPTSASSLDYEAFQTAVVVVGVSDLGDEFALSADPTTLNISLTNVNDEVPQMDPIDCPCFIMEHTFPASCPPLSAHDRDTDSAAVIFQITDGETQLFRIDASTGIVSIRQQLDREMNDTYQLEISVTDNILTSPPRVLTVRVVDVNDMQPVYPLPSITLTVPSDLAPGDVAGQFEASNGDVGYNALTRYEVISGTLSGTFRLDPLSGTLYTVQTPTSNSYAFTVSASDLLNPLTLATQSVTVTVSGLKNNHPSFSSATEYRTVPEDLPTSSLVAQLMAEDRDTGPNGQLQYSIVEGNHSDLFTLSGAGVLSLSQSLSGRAGSVFVLNVSTTDGGMPPLRAYQQLVLTVYAGTLEMTSRVYNPNVPVCHYSGSVVEGLDDPAVITSLDSTQDGQNIQYTILEGDSSSAFQLSPDGLSLTAMGGFPNVFSQTVFVTLLAEYGANFHKCSVTISIQDVNNNPPVFGEESLSFEVYRVSPVGAVVHQVMATDADVGTNARTTYSISNPSSLPFEVDSNMGAIRVSGGLTSSSYTFTVVAMDTGLAPPNSDTITVTAIVVATPNSAPVFTALPSSVNVSESFRGMVVAAQISDGDGDLSIQARNSFCIASGNFQGAFEIAREGGELRATERLDYEALPEQLTLTLLSYDNSPNPATGTATLELVLGDVNEPPAFSVPLYRASMKEGVGLGTEVVRVSAADGDEGVGGVRYAILRESPFFAVEPTTGVVTTDGNLNRENMPVITFTVTATDEGTPPASSQTQVQVTLRDINNFPPSFTSPASLAVSESAEVGEELTVLTAMDRDEGANARLLFTILTGNSDRRFSLDPWTGSLRLARGINFEEDPTTYPLSLQVQDLGTPSMTSLPFALTITVTDSNEDPPTFSSLVYECSIREFTNMFQEPCQVSATDADRTGNTVTYSLVDSSSLFSVHASSGVINSVGLVSSQDRIAMPTYILPIRAADSHQTTPRTSTALVVISVISTNDPPEPETEQAFSFYEGAPANSLLFFAHAHDRDVSEDFATVTYGFQEDEDTFRLDEVTGAVFLAEELDYEGASSSHSFRVIAVNSETTPFTSMNTLYTITVLDVNENALPPEFPPNSNPTSVLLSRGSSVGTHVVSLSARDPEGRGVSYHITGGSGVGYFQIDPSTGNMTTRFSLAAIQDSSVTLLVRATDGSSQPLSSFHELTVALSPLTTSQPFFIRPVFQASPSEGVRGVVAAVRAEVESQFDDTVTYSILEGNDGTFAIHPQSGAISVASTANLDREARSLYSLVVGAHSTPSSTQPSSRALLVLEVRDANDFRPEFVTDVLNFTVFETFPVGAANSMARIFATDGDVGENGRLTYTLSSSSNDPTFAIASDTGYIYLTSSLDRTQSTSHSFTVTATDHGTTGGFSDSILVTVRVDPTPAGTTRPILQPITSPSLAEDTPPGRLIATATLGNGNAVTNAVLYRLVERTTLVSITPHTGEIYLTGHLDHETESTLSYTVEVLDGQSGTISTPLVINVMDVNNNRPAFSQPAYTFQLSEAATPEDLVGGVVASDAESAQQLLTYSIMDSLHPDSLGLFEVGSTGLISVSGAGPGVGGLDREVIPLHVLTVGVTDGGTPPLKDFVTVSIRMVDVDDHAPQFVPASVAVSVSEDVGVGEVIYTATAFDPDEGSNAEVTYSLVTSPSPFLINSSTGDLTLATPLDAEVQTVHNITITAMNPSDPSSSSATPLSLTVQVLDVLDSTPQLMAQPSTPSIRENYPAYSRVGRVQCPGCTRQVYYQIVAGNSQEHFLVEPLTGVLRTTMPLDREEVGSYQLVVQGAYEASFVSNLTLTVTVTDANDARPRFHQPFTSLQIPENSPTGVSLARLEVEDADEGQNGAIGRFVIQDQPAAEVFRIDSEGNVILNSGQELDREGRFSSLRFTVHAIDAGTPMQYGTAEVQVEVTDENDPPRFEGAPYAFTLSTPVAINVPQFRVQAVDMDLGPNSVLGYSLQGEGATGTFSIDPTTGDISVIDSFSLQASYSLTVRARDGGGMEASASVEVTVRPCGFANLTFTPSSSVMTVSVLENTSVNSILVPGSDFQVLDLSLQEANVRFTSALPDPLFEVEEASGNIRLLAPGLDRETAPVHRLVVQATDQSDASRVAQARVTVSVLDVNDNPPTFDPPTYSDAISTQEPPGPLLRVTATDPDQGANSRLTYALAAPHDSFSVNPGLGVVSLVANVTDLGNTITLVVVATDAGDPPLSAQATVSVRIIDPRAPVFDAIVYSQTIPETTPTGTVVLNLTLATDSTHTGELSFRFINADVPLPFSVSSSGAISLVDPGVDYEVETQRRYNLMARVRDSDTGLTNTATVIVEVSDSNDNAPVFGSNGFYDANVTENAPRGTPVLQVRAEDPDSTPNALVTYRLSGEGPFSIHPSNGSVYLSREVDYENTTSYQLEVLAQDSGSPSLTSTATVFVSVGNINDNPPIFRQASYETFVRDNDQPGPTSLFVTADDQDNLGALVYGIVPGPGSEAFSVSSNGRINLAVAEPTELSYTLNVSASDSVFFGYATVFISVEGVNAHLPVFNQSSYTGTVPEKAEPGLFVAQVFATDMDRGTNGQVTYLLQSTETRFTVDPSEGVVQTFVNASSIDRETTPSFSILVTAMDGGSFSAITELLVTVEDVNDNNPAFTILDYFATIVSLSPDPFELAISAIDPDAGSNGSLTYAIVNPIPDQQLIFLIQETGVITNVPGVSADIDIQSSYMFLVTVSDNGSPPLMALLNATVNIEVVPDDTPRPSFEMSRYDIEIPENVERETTVIQLLLNPSTTGLDVCAVVEDYRLMGGSLDGEEVFELRSSSEALIRTASEDNIPVRTWQVIVEASCHTTNPAAPVLRILATVFINVTEVNDQPEFTNPVYFGSVPENAQHMAIQMVTPQPISATDPDPQDSDDGMLTYSLSGDNSEKFDITTTGVVVTQGGLDFEAEPEKIIRVQVLAVDAGSPPLTASAILVVTLLDVNDNPPLFNQLDYSVSISESAEVGALVHTAEVTDLDADSTHIFTIGGSVFAIGERSGEVRLARPLDRETQENHTAEIVASDGEHSTSATLHVTVLDANDHAPVFEQAVYEVTLPENFPAGVTFVRVSATDQDEGQNAVVVYGQVGVSGDETIAINNSTGEVSFLTPPDYEAAAQLSLSVQATDVFEEQRSIATVVVRLTDENDNAPTFGRPSYTGSIRENLPAGSTLEIDLADRVEALDPDNGENGTVAYRMEGPDAAFFNISNGDIVSLTSFDRETRASYEILVVATDMGPAPMSSNASVLIRIGDVNDNYPIFQQSIYRVTVNESAVVSSSVFTTTATDLDAGVNSQIIMYAVSGDNSADFRVATEEGGVLSLYVNAPLDHENPLRRVYTLTLIALDGGLNQGSASLVLTVADINDNSPEFSESPYSLTRPEDILIGTVLIRVNATDRDSNDQVLYSIRNAGNHPEFSINALTGEISVAASLDFETAQEHSLDVIASDSANEVSALVIVTLTDVNDNHPVFPDHASSISVQENEPAPALLLSLTATDRDSDDARISYVIVSGNEGEAFDISLTGDLTVQRPLDRETVDSYTLNITAQDNGSPSLSNSTLLTVLVTDVNDNPPTGGHQDLLMFLLEGQAPLISLGRVFVNDSDIDNSHQFTLLPTAGTGNIQIDDADGSIRVGSRTPEVGTYFFLVNVRDLDLAPVNTTISVRVRDVTSLTLQNSFRMQFSDLAPGQFVDAHLSCFLMTASTELAAGLGVSEERLDVQLISVQPSVSPPSHTDVTVAVWDRSGLGSGGSPDGSYLPPVLVQHVLHTRREVLEGASPGLRIRTVSVNTCAGSQDSDRCDLGSTCTGRYTETLSQEALGSGAVTYLGVASTLTSSCVAMSAPPCDPSPSLSCPEPATCLSEETRSGELLVDCIRDCSSSPCKNAGECTNQNPGYHCTCPEGFDGRNCEITTANFSEESYALFPPLGSRSLGSISLEFRPESQRVENSLLFFSGRFDQEDSDILYVEFVDGVPQLTFSRGGGMGGVEFLNVSMGGVWHTLHVEFNYQELSFSVVTYNPLTPAKKVAMTRTTNFHSFDLNGPLVLGRLEEEFGYDSSFMQLRPSRLPSFRGCVRNVLVNGQPLDFGEALTASGVSEGCGCEEGLCRNGGRCSGTGQCDCPADFTGPTCAQPAGSIAFLGEEFVNYQILSTGVAPLKRRRRQLGMYVTAQNILSLSFTTERPSGTLLQLGGPGQGDHMLLKIANGQLRLDFDLGSGGRVLQLSRKVADGAAHSVLVTRTEDVVELLLDGRYLNRTSGPASEGANITLDISSEHIFLGAEVDVSTRELTDGFTGCLTGVRLDRRDLPFTEAGSVDFGVLESSSGDIISGCPLFVITEVTHPELQVYAGIGGILGGVLLISFLFVLVCAVAGFCWRTRHGEHSLRSRGGSPSHGGFTWQPTYNPDRKSPPMMAQEDVLDMKFSPGHVSSGDETDGGGVVETTFTGGTQVRVQEGGRPTTRARSPPFPGRQVSRSSGRRQQVVAPPPEGFTAMSQANPGFLQESPVVGGGAEGGARGERTEQQQQQQQRREGEEGEARPPNRFVQHMRSLSGHMSIRSTGSGKSDVSYIPRELLGMDDAEVTKYIRKKVELADLDNEEHDVDIMEHYKEEGPFEPLGSIGSLYDFLQDVEAGDRQARPAGATPVTSQTLSNQATLPVAASVRTQSGLPHSRGQATEPSSDLVNSRPATGPKPPIPVKPPVTPSKRPTTPTSQPVSPSKRPTSPAKAPVHSPTRPGKRPMPMIVRTQTTPSRPPPPAPEANQLPLTRTSTSPIKSPTTSAPPGYETKPADPVLLSPSPPPGPAHPSPRENLTPSKPTENGLWEPVSKQQSASQPGSQGTGHGERLTVSGGGKGPLKSDPTKLRRSGRRSHRVANQNAAVGNILEKFHQVTANVGHMQTSSAETEVL